MPRGSKRLLAYVALHRRRVERCCAAEALWPLGHTERAAGNLRSALWRLRGAGINVLDTDKWTLWLNAEVAVDVHQVSERASRLITGTGQDDDLTLSPSWVNALDLLPGCYDDWALLERERLRQRTLHALEALSGLLTRAGRHADAVDAAILAVSAEPPRESAQRTLIEAHLAEGNFGEAHQSYLRYRLLAKRELGVEPSETLAHLVQQPQVAR